MSIKVLVIGAVWPESNSSAAGQNMAALLAHFKAHNYSVHFASAAADSPHKDQQLGNDITLHSIALNDDSFDAFIAGLQPGIVVFDRFMTEEQFSARVRRQCPDALHILNTEDLHSLRHARHEAVKQGFSAATARLNNAFAQREVAAILRCDLSLIISATEYELLTGYYQVPTRQLLLFPLQQPLTPVNQPLAYSEREHFITVGNFRHAPNWDAVLQLKQLWPGIRAQLPDAQLHIYGAYPPKKATQLHNTKQGFLVKGWVDDIGNAMSQARVCLAPLRFGAGIKGKLLTAMQYATPSITTPIGAEGIASAEQWPGSIVDPTDHAAFITRACELYGSESIWQPASHSALKQAVGYRQHQAAGVEHLFATIPTLMADLPAFREGLFLQSVLWHHSLRACQFMSQWIEAKNR